MRGDFLISSKKSGVAAATMAPPPPAERALTLDAIIAFTEQHDLWDKPTWHVAQNVIMPATAAAEDRPARRFYELVEPSQVGSVDIFVSHSWANSWGLLVAACRAFVADVVGEEGEFHLGMGAGLTYVSRQFAKRAEARSKESGVAPTTRGGQLRLWVDIFAVMQHDDAGHGKLVDVSALTDVVDASAATLMVLDEEASTLTRAWCLHECAQTIISFERHKRVEVPAALASRTPARSSATVPLKPNHVFHARIGTHARHEFAPASVAVMKRAVQNVDVRLAQAKYPADLAMIMEEAAKVRTEKYGSGLDAVNKMGRMALSNVLSNAELQ